MHVDPNVPWKDAVTLGVALLGAALGVMNTWNAMSQRKVRLRVKPSFAIAIPHGGAAICIDVVNLSAFTVTVTEVGFAPRFTRGSLPRRYVVPDPAFVDHKSWPRRLEPREAVTAYIDPASISDHRRDFYKAYVRTSCGEIAYGHSRALDQMRQS